MADESYISKAPIRRLMRSFGADLVAEEAVTTLIDFLEKYGMEVTKKAIKVAEADKRKKVTSGDLALATKE